jgi:hypothetical protein
VKSKVENYKIQALAEYTEFMEKGKRGRGRKAEGGGQRSEVRGQRSEVRSQKTVVGKTGDQKIACRKIFPPLAGGI